MKAFRGTLIAAVLLILVGVALLVLRPAVFAPAPEGPKRLFTFEKHELVKVDVRRPDGTQIALVEKDGEWRIDGTDFVAGRSMVNRVKHQIHDLTARASVVEGAQAPELYGLGANAVRVTLTLRDGQELAFEAGDPNPSAVSYYIRPVPGDAIYTVKKAAVDYYSLTLDEFRERRFASFDGDDVTGVFVKADVPGAPARLEIRRAGETQWEMTAPTQMAANDDQVRRLLGRISALKASRFIEVQAAPTPEALASWGLATPRVDLTLRFESRGPLRLLVGADAPDEGTNEELAYMMLLDGEAAGDPFAPPSKLDDTVYVARRGLLDELKQDPSAMRNRRVVRMAAADVVAVDATLKARDGEPLQGAHGVRLLAEQWVWADGVPVPGSTPERVAQMVSELEVEQFIDAPEGDLVKYGLGAPVATVTLSDREGASRVVQLGALGPVDKDPEGNPRPRRYARVEGDSAIYLIDERVIRVVDDLIREGNRKAERDAEKAERLERIPSAPAPEPPPAP